MTTNIPSTPARATRSNMDDEFLVETDELEVTADPDLDLVRVEVD